MIVSLQSLRSTSTQLLIEGWLTAIAVGLSFLFPRLGSGWFARIERVFMRVARRKGLAVASVGFSVLLLRLAILPFLPVPLPHTPDDFSFLLAADTFAHGRLTNPTPAMWTHFESVHITMVPTYMSMYFPGYGLVLAAGKVVFGNPWFATLCLDALMCAGICWMLQAWLPANWALFGGMLAVLRLGLFSHWVTTLEGGEALLAAFAGALVLGALPRLMRTAWFRYGMLLGAGITILALTRPYEGVLLCLPVALALVQWAWRGKNRPRPAVLLRCAVVPLALIFAALAWLGYYNYRAYGSPFTLPYTVDRAEYAMAPYFVWQSARPAPHYRHALMRRFYYENELKYYKRIHSYAGFIPWTLVKAVVAIFFFAGFALIPPLFMARRVVLDHRVRFLTLCLAILMAGIVIEVFMLPRYLATFTVVFYALGLQAMRHLRVWAPRGAPVGKTMVRLSVVVCLLVGGLQLFATSRDSITLAQTVTSSGESQYVAKRAGLERAQIEDWLEKHPGKQLVFVHYMPNHNPIETWIYNHADIKDSKVIWAWDMGAVDNMELLHHYPNRKAWLVEPDTSPPTVTAYPVEPGASAH